MPGKDARSGISWLRGVPGVLQVCIRGVPGEHAGARPERKVLAARRQGNSPFAPIPILHFKALCVSIGVLKSALAGNCTYWLRRHSV